jgi:hypothetical protein
MSKDWRVTVSERTEFTRIWGLALDSQKTANTSRGQPCIKCTAYENSKQIFPGEELRGYSPNFYIHVSVSDLYIPLIGLLILLQENRFAHRHMNVEIGTGAVQFLFWEHINPNFFAVCVHFRTAREAVYLAVQVLICQPSKRYVQDRQRNRLSGSTSLTVMLKVNA